MPARIRYRPRFLDDFVDQAEWLRSHAEPDRLDRFRRGLTRLEEVLGRFPSVGTELRRGRGVVLRRWSFPDQLPFLVYYEHADREPISQIWLVRLFHFAQDRQAPDLTEWE